MANDRSPGAQDERADQRDTRFPVPRAALVVLAVAIGAVLAGGVAAVPVVATRGTSADPAIEPAATVVTPPAPMRRLRHRDPAVRPPTRIDIPAIGVAAPIDETGLLDDGTMAVPDDFDRTGWFRGLEAPGEVGTAVIVGHLDSYTGPAVFFRIPELGGGEVIIVTRADGSTVRFVVDRVEQYAKAQFPTIAVYAPAGEPSLRILTCGGTFDRRTRHYSDNVVVYARLEEAT